MWVLRFFLSYVNGISKLHPCIRDTYKNNRIYVYTHFPFFYFFIQQIKRGKTEYQLMHAHINLFSYCLVFCLSRCSSCSVIILCSFASFFFLSARLSDLLIHFSFSSHFIVYFSGVFVASTVRLISFVLPPKCPLPPFMALSLSVCLCSFIYPYIYLYIFTYLSI